LTPLATFGGGDGWLSPGEGGYGFLGNGNFERGLAYGNGHLYLVSRTGGTNLRILDPVTGTDGSGNDLGFLDTTGISGGTFAVDMVAVGGDGVIYVGNLQATTNPGGGAFYKVYSWVNEASAPAVAYSGDAGITGARIGDDLAVIGSGSSTRLAAGFNNSPSISGNNGYSIIDPTAGTATAVAFTGTPPNAGDFKLGITFTDSSHVIGGPTSVYRYTSFSGTAGTLLASPALTHPGGSTAERLMAYTTMGGRGIVAVQSTGDSHVSIYDVTDPTAPQFLTEGNNVVQLGLSTNPNATGELAWGAATNDGNGTYSQNLYAMSTNQGIQAFTFTLTPPLVSGDYNANHVVDAGDYVLWRKTPGSYNGDPAGYMTWQANFGNAAGAGSGGTLGATGAVPEPNVIVLAITAALGLIAISCRS
jgi:hypothetical protein